MFRDGNGREKLRHHGVWCASGDSRVGEARKMMQGLFRSLLVLLAVAELYWLLPPRLPVGTPAAPPDVRIGALHLLSPEPLTHERLEHLTARAKERGIDFLVIADPKSSHARSLGLEGAYDGVDVYVEMEAHVTAGHAMVFYSHTEARELSDEAASRTAWRHFLGNDPRPGMFLVVAHPDSQSNPWNRLDRFSEGIELVNVNTLWRNQQETAPLSLMLTTLLFPFSNYLATLRLVHVPDKNLQAWDAINSVSNGHFGINAQEIPAHSLVPPWMAPHWSLAQAMLPSALNAVHVQGLSGSTFETRRQLTYEALARGRSTMFFPLRYPRYATDWQLECGEKAYRPGDSVPAALSGCNFVVKIDPDVAKLSPSVRLIRDGKQITQWERTSQTSLTHALTVDTAGAYRLEIGIPTRTPLGILLNQEVPYAFYNPIYVR